MNTHLSEQQIQDYLDNNINHSKKQTIEEHLAECPSCRAEIKHYKKLYSILGNDIESCLSTKFNFNVLNRLKNIPIKKPKTWIYYLLGLFGFFIILGTSLYFRDLKPFYYVYAQFKILINAYILPYVELFQNLSSSKSMNYLFLSFIIIFIIGTIDRLFFSSEGFSKSNKILLII